MISEIDREIDQFLLSRDLLLERGFNVEEIDSYGCVIHLGKSKSDRIDLLITGIVHGEEVIGIEIINHMMSLLLNMVDVDISLGFLLCNVEAAKENKRFIETDLNRSFGVKTKVSAEHHRAEKIANIVRRSDFILDIHQTVEPSLTPFFIFEHNTSLITLIHHLLPEIPIVTFSGQSFSQDGKTMLEYAGSVNSKAIALECGQQGFSAEMTLKVSALCFKLIKEIKSKEYSETFPIRVIHLSDSIRNSGKTNLVPGLVNYMLIQKGDILAYDELTPVLAPFEGRLIFPRYGELAKISGELCNLGREIDVY